MLALIIKGLAVLFFSYLSIDAFFRTKKIRLEVEKKLTSPVLGRTLRRREVRNAVFFLCLALAAVFSFFIRIAPLGE